MNRPTQMWAKAQAAVDARDCTRCGRPKGRPCKNLRNGAWRKEEDLVIPHKERYEDA